MEKTYKYLSGGLVGRDSSGEGRRVAFVECSDGTVYLQEPLHRAFGDVGWPVSESLEAVRSWVSAPCKRAFQAVDDDIGQFDITIDPAEGDAARGEISGVAMPAGESR